MASVVSGGEGVSEKKEVAGFEAFALERYFAIYEFSGAKLLCCSDCEPLTQKEVLEMADSETRSLWDNLTLGYTESAGLPQLRKEVAKSYTKGNIDEQDVTIVCPEEGIYLSIRALVSKGDEVVVTSPAYQSLTEIAKACGAALKTWNPVVDEANDGALRFDIDDFSALVTAQTKLVIINFPHNPTGCQLSREDFDKIISVCESHKSYLFSDEMYRGLELDEGAQNPAACEAYERAVSLSGMSKVYAMPGLRIGWLASRCAELNAKVRMLKDYTTICPPAPSEILALIGLRAGKSIIDRNLAIIRENCKAVDAFMERHKGTFRWKRPVAGSFAFPSLRDKDDSIMKRCKEWVEEGNVMLLPSPLYEFGDSHFRLGLGRVDAKEVLELWEQYLLKASPRGAIAAPRPNTFVCRKCGHTLFTASELCGADMHTITSECESYFLSEPMDWMGYSEGKTLCPNCETRIGTLKWSGCKCSCGTWVSPGVQIPHSRIDAKYRKME